MGSNALMKILVSLGLDASDFDKGIKDAESKASGLEKGLAKVGGAAVLGGIAAVGAGAVALGGFLASTIEPASDLGESVNAVNVVFGEGAAAMLKYGETAAQTVGLSNREFNQMATTTGAFLQNVGFDMNSAGEETIKLTERAADMASVFNTDVATAMNAIQSGLKGEMNPLEQFGVKLNAAMVEAKALSMGLGESTVDMLAMQEATLKVNKAAQEAAKMERMYGLTHIKTQEAIIKRTRAEQKLEEIMAGGKVELTDAMKAQATLALIYEQTAKTQGDFLNTADSLPNAMKAIGASFEDIKAKIGTALLPMLQTLAGKLKEAFSSPAFQAGLTSFIDGISQMATFAMTYLPVVFQWVQAVFGWLSENEGVIVGALAAIAVAIGMWAKVTITAAIPAMIAFMTAAWPVILVLAAVGAAAYLLYEAWTNNWGGIRDKAQEAWATIQPVLQTLKTWLETNIPVAIQALTNYWNTVLLPAIRAVWAWTQANLIPLLKALGEVITAVVGVAVTALAGIWQNVLQPALQTVADLIAAHLSPTLNRLGEIAGVVADFVGDKLAGAFDGVAGAIRNAITWLLQLAEKLRNIKLPSWMTPGSPTPWEIGLLGVGKAMRKLTATALPQLEARLNMDTPIGVSRAQDDRSERVISVTNNIFSKEQPGQITNALSLAALRGGAA